MTSRVIAIVIAGLLALSNSADARMTVSDLTAKCKSGLSYQDIPDPTPQQRARIREDGFSCISYINGVSDMQLTMRAFTKNETIGPWCMPRGETPKVRKIINLFLTWSEQHQEAQKWPASVGLSSALRLLFPCQ